MKSGTRLIPAIPMLAGLAVATGACQSPTETELRAAGWTPHEVVARGTPIYCYTSIAERRCYAEPLIGEQRRLIRAYAPVSQ